MLDCQQPACEPGGCSGWSGSTTITQKALQHSSKREGALVDRARAATCRSARGSICTCLRPVLPTLVPSPPPLQLYSNSHFALAALLPASLVSPQDGAIAKVADVGLAAAITVHNHIALNYGKWGPGPAPQPERG